jgi:2-dehydro-3-deoxyphosphogluconate aldolase/(4S)-4-hydroxy-2-oxoglutarate aldolase
METNELLRARLVPVVVLDRAEDAEPLAEALAAGGLPVAEVTFRTAAAPEAIRRMCRRGGITVGAGTVLNASQVEAAAEAGAQFIVSPGFSPAVVEACRERHLPVIPGAVTPSEIMAALEAGLDVLKFFPASRYGGPATLKDLAGPFGNVRFVPTGGVSEANLADYLGLPNVAAVGGSWMVAKKLVAAGAFDQISALCAQAVAAAAAVQK